MQHLPDKLYSVDSIIRLEQAAIQQYDIPAFELMKRAGNAVFDVIQNKYSDCKKILILCGAGNNAGDGYVIARLLKQAGYSVQVISLIDPGMLKNEAALAYQDWSVLAENTKVDFSHIKNADIIIDALLGTGLSREISDIWLDWISAVNAVAIPVISVDIPSGLSADTGNINNVAIKADITVTFIGLKQGMFTAQAKDVCGDIIFQDLALPSALFEQSAFDAKLVSKPDLSWLPKRQASSHKGNFGHVLIVGGNDGMPGAVILAATAALRTGAGLVTIMTVAKNLSAISAAVPEAMVKTCDLGNIEAAFDVEFVNSITHIAIGMGLGCDDWSNAVLKQCVKTKKPMLLDADALNGLADTDISISSSVVITPHPGEAGRLLSNEKTVSSKDIQRNRFEAIKKLHAKFFRSSSCVVVLKGSGTLIFDGDTLSICNLGNAAMSTPGMGDVLSGILIAIMAQHTKSSKVSMNEMAVLAVCLHARAAYLVSRDNTRGLLASDVVTALPEVLQ